LGGSLTDEQLQYERAQLRSQVLSGALDDKTVELELEDTSPLDLPVMPSGGGEEMGLNIQEVLGSMLPRRKKTRTVTIREARRLLANEESAKLLDHEAIKRDAVKLAERQGIILLDEIDKIASRKRGGGGPEVSREGVQRDILPIVEGCTVMTKHGPVRTHHILFIAAGAFHVSKPSDLIPELQGRFPIRVELESLTEADFVRILTEPENALIKQYSALLATEGVEIEFTPEGIEQMAHLARRVNDTTENIGARRLHTMLEKVLEDLSFESPSETHQHVIIDAEYVRARLESIVLDEDLSRFVL
jgi:ATP-dependent HslUV protease ATP-binding subunit HslU